MTRRRLFVAVWPPDTVVRALGRLERPALPGLRWTTPDQWHVTLSFLGGLDGREEQAVRGALDDTDWLALGPRETTAGPMPEPIGRTVWAVPVSGLDDLATASNAAADRVLLSRPGSPRRYRGHLTLARTKTPASLRTLPTPDFQASWPVGEITLVCSRLDPAGARYEIVGRWSLDSRESIDSRRD